MAPRDLYTLAVVLSYVLAILVLGYACYLYWMIDESAVTELIVGLSLMLMAALMERHENKQRHNAFQAKFVATIDSARRTSRPTPPPDSR